MPTIRYEPDAKEIFVTEETILRDATIKNSIDLYKTFAKLMNCGGVGQCGTCVVEVLSGAENLSERTDAEERKLRNKPATYRLACQTLVMGDITVRTKPK
jgi:ferredoxin